ncbi:MAG: anti-sigma factor [Acetobacteraceae bacterium]
MSGTAEERDLTAGEYVLGTLDVAAADAFEQAAPQDPELAAAIAAWQRRLSPLAGLVAPVAPPADLWVRIEASTGKPELTQPVRIWRNVAFWRFATAGALALTAIFAGLLISRPVSRPTLMATIAPTGKTVPIFIAEVQPGGALLMRALSPVVVAKNKALELWALPAGATMPVALGVLPSTGRRLQTASTLGNATELMISLEPPGGSPTGQPTGPVVYKGRLSRIE